MDVLTLKTSFLTFQLHANMKALLKSAERTAFPLSLINPAELALVAGVHLVVLHRSFKKTLQRQTILDERGCFIVSICQS